MTVYVLSAPLTNAPADAEAFLEAAAHGLELASVVAVRDDGHAFGVAPSHGDGVVFANPAEGEDAGPAAAAVLDLARRNGAVLLPVAMTEATRRPPEAAAAAQSFDVVDDLRKRGQGPGDTATAARSFARQALARVLPTMAADNVRMFLCHRRADGEPLVAAVDAALSQRHSRFFRDLVDVQVGDAAQDRIVEALAAADVLVLFDTPLCGGSDWVKLELATALGRGIPVVWVRVGPDEDRETLEVPPSKEPHLVLRPPPGGLSPAEVGAAADAILAAAHELNLAHLRRARETFSRIRHETLARGATVETLDAREQIYSVTAAARKSRLPVRPEVHVLQVFARHPTPEDRAGLVRWLDSHGHGPHEASCRAFDAAVLLDPLPAPATAFDGFGVVEPARDYLDALASPAPAHGPAHDGTMLLLGAFPSAVATHGSVMEAVHALATTWLRLGGSVVCGGHPTFTPLLTEVLRLLGLPRERLIVYQSRYYATPASLQDLAGRAVVVATDSTGERESSLTAMRARMVAESGRAAAVTLGGRTAEGGEHVPGVDEELALAAAAGMPAYLLGAAGGRARELAEAARGAGWPGQANGLDAVDNERLAASDAYEEIARTVWTAGS